MSTNSRQPEMFDPTLDRRQAGIKSPENRRFLSGKSFMLIVCTGIGAIFGMIVGPAWHAAIPFSFKSVTSTEADEHSSNTTETAKTRFDLLRNDFEQKLATLKRTSSSLLDGSDSETPAVVHQSSRLNEALVEAQKRTLESRALFVSVQNALVAGSDLQPFLQQFSSDVTLRESNPPANGTLSTTRRDAIRGEGRVGSFTSKTSPEMGKQLLESAKRRFRQAGIHEETLRQLDESIQAEAANLKLQLSLIESIESQWKEMSATRDVAFGKRETPESASNPDPNASGSDGAVNDDAPADPMISTTVIFCMFLGFIAGIIVIFLRDILRDRHNSVAALQRRFNLPLLAEIHKLKSSSSTGLEAIVAFADEGGIESRPFRTLRSSIVFSCRNAQRLLITSTEPGDGKTTTATNLAVAFAQSSKKTLLIDADIHQRGTTKLLALHGARGLSQILNDDKPIKQSCLENIFNLGIENLDVMPAGSVPNNLAELFLNDRLSELFAWTSANYEHILIDAPSILSATQLESLGQFVDGAILVIRPDKNRRKSVLRTVDSCRNAGVEIVGFVANHLNIETGSILAKHRTVNHDPANLTNRDEEAQKPRLAA
jgi:capsular exopolysaccharide synthesis family protein